MSAGLIEEARRLASFAPEKPESVHDVVCAGFELTEQLAARTRDFLAAVERNEEKDRRISDLEEQLEALEQQHDNLLDLARRVSNSFIATQDRFGKERRKLLWELHDAAGNSNPAKRPS